MRRSEQLYDIQMALVRNYGYSAQKVDNRDDDPMLHVRDDADRVLMIITVSSDEQYWVVIARGHRPVVLPIDTTGSQIADAIVPVLDELDK